jgi:DNA-directed RNA polymerase subunit RPC12/RpoP
MGNYYCRNCGMEFSSVNALTAATCRNHPNGSHKGKHELYEGCEKSKYTCKYCGLQASSLRALTAATCRFHPNGSHKGKHIPAL